MKLSKKYGLPFDHGRKKLAPIRLFRSVLTLKFRQAARYLGVTHALDLIAS